MFAVGALKSLRVHNIKECIIKLKLGCPVMVY